MRLLAMPILHRTGAIVASDNDIHRALQQTVANTNGLLKAPWAMRDSTPLKPPRRRPALAQWLWARGYTWKEAGELFGCSGEAVRLWCLPFDDAARRRPEDGFMQKIRAVTAGEVGPEDFFVAPPAAPAADPAPQHNGDAR